MNEFFTTLARRPYVFAFLVAYAVLAWRLWGWRRALLWLVSGYAIAWLSEFSSIHNGFPYGEYHYLYENLAGELMVAGVPFFDSLSYPFLIFAGYTTSLFILKGDHGPWTMDHGPKKKGRWSMVNSQWSIIFVGAFLTMLLDVIIDPVAGLGSQWFLGEIYYYAHPGWYFGVPATNFAGWFLVPLIVISINVGIWRICGRPDRCHTDHRPWTMDHRPKKKSQWSMVNGQWSHLWLYPTFYASIALFNIAVSFCIGAWKLGLASSAILCAIITMATVATQCKRV